MKFMKAVQVNSPGANFEIVQKAIPEPRNNEVLIKVEAFPRNQISHYSRP